MSQARLSGSRSCSSTLAAITARRSGTIWCRCGVNTVTTTYVHRMQVTDSSQCCGGGKSSNVAQNSLRDNRIAWLPASSSRFNFSSRAGLVKSCPTLS
jgi:hypothetical protein